MSSNVQASAPETVFRNTQELRSLMDANRSEPDVDRELKIRNLRLTDELYGDRKPAAIEDGAVELSYAQEMPTCSLDEVTPEMIRAAFRDRGCLYIPGALGGEDVEILRDAIESAQNAARDEEGDPTWFSPPKLGNRDAMMKLASVRRWSLAAGGTLAIDSPRAMYRICDVYDRHGIRAMAERYLGEPPVFSHSKFMLWRVEGTGEESGWHQDGRFLGDKIDIASINLWTALTDCGAGEDAPGMELVLDYPDHYIMPAEDSHFDWSVSDNQVDEMYRGKVPVVIPTFKAGDMLLFDHWLLHRSSRLAEQCNRRYAIESWFFAPSVFPVGRKAVIA